jgi:hypothetical protein
MANNGPFLCIGSLKIQIFTAIFLSEAVEASQCYFFFFFYKTQISNPPKCAASFFKTWRSILVGHFGLQSVTL